MGEYELAKKQEMEELLRRNEQERKRLHAVMELTGDTLFEYDMKEDRMELLHSEDGILQRLRVTEKYSTTMPGSRLFEDSKTAAKIMDVFRSGTPKFYEEARRLGTDGLYHWIAISGRTLYAEDGTPEKVIGKLALIDEQKDREETLRRKSREDSMTGVLNKNTVRDEIKARLEVQRDEQVSYLIICDVDDFKNINDVNGHLFGDAVLCYFADEIRRIFPEGLVGRIGGDEFLLFVEDIAKEDLRERLDLLNRSMANQYHEGEHATDLSCSIGVAENHGEGFEYDVLFRWADYSLYKVKRRGKGSFHIHTVREGEAEPSQTYLGSKSNRKKAVTIREEALIKNADSLALFCVELLENVKDFDNAMKMICDRMCNFFDLDDIVFLEHIEDEKKIVYQWNRQKKEKQALRMLQKDVYVWDNLVSRTDEDGILIYEDTSKENVETEQATSCMLIFTKDWTDYRFSAAAASRGAKKNWKNERDALFQVCNVIFQKLRTEKLQEQENLKLEKLLNYDELTGLPVYSHFNHLMKEYAHKYSTRNLFYFYTDITNFSYVNEIYGYKEGDKILVKFAKELQEKCEGGIHFSRISSDNFVGVIKAENVEVAKERIHTLTKKFCARMNKKYNMGSIVMATGLYQITGREKSVSIILDNANEARKISKEQKAECETTIYTETVQKQNDEKKAIMANMVSALENNEFTAYLQPKVSLVTGKVVGAEALVRWIRPDGTMVMPGQFIDLFEKNGFITKVDFHILKEVLKYLKEAEELGEERVPISVNFSRRHTEDDNFVETVRKMLKKYKIAGEYLEAEITESVFMSDLSKLNETIGELQKHGILVSIDDFGSGYSSLNVLSNVKADIIKLDRGFLNYIDKQKAYDFIKYLIHLMKHMGCDIIAEGVETEEQIEMLYNAGCDTVQGYYYAKPMPIKEFRRFIKEFNK